MQLKVEVECFLHLLRKAVLFNTTTMLGVGMFQVRGFAATERAHIVLVFVVGALTVRTVATTGVEGLEVWSLVGGCLPTRATFHLKRKRFFTRAYSIVLRRNNFVDDVPNTVLSNVLEMRAVVDNLLEDAHQWLIDKRLEMRFHVQLNNLQ